MNQHLLSATTKLLTASSKGILAADESINTIGKRFAKINLANNQEHRRKYRSLLLETPGLSQYINGIILFEETLTQVNDQQKLLTSIMAENGILVGIKVDQGLKPLANFQGEYTTIGLDTLEERLTNYAKSGASFAKWRNVMVIDEATPSITACASNADTLARYAASCQAAGIVPIIEPEVLADGHHSIATCAKATKAVLDSLYAALADYEVSLEHTILKTNMILPGHNASKVSDLEVARQTLAVLTDCVPPIVPSINFLSGGQTPTQATKRLQAINELNNGNNHWKISFSYGRALQEPSLLAWQGDDKNRIKAQQLLLHRAKMNNLANLAAYISETD